MAVPRRGLLDNRTTGNAFELARGGVGGERMDDLGLLSFCFEQGTYVGHVGVSSKS